jgi:aminocarboxymuconate-semialdehyde decarboxylase
LVGEVVSIWTELGSYDLPPEQGRAWARLYNEGLARFIQDQPRGLDLWGLGIVPLQDPEGAVQELDHAMRACGLRGALIVANPPNLRLGDKELDGFWARAEALNATLFIHPNIGFAPGLDQPYLLGVLMGAPVDTTFSAATLVAAGVLDRHPTLRILLAHGGGFFPFQAGRFAFMVQKDGVGGRLGYRCERPIDHYLTSFYYDTLLYDPGTIRRLADQVGTSQLLAGSDYPFPTYEVDTIDAIVASGLPEAAVEALLHGNATRLLDLAPRS